MNKDIVEFYKPNELIAVIDQFKVSRLAKHLGNYFLKHAQEQLKFHNYVGNTFTMKISETNDLADIREKDYKLIEKSLLSLIQPVVFRDKDNPQNIKALAPIYFIEVDTNNGVYKYKIEEEHIIPLLKGSDYFTKLNLAEFNPLNSKHSWTILEWLRRYENSHQIPVMTIDELRGITNTADKKTYDNFSNIKIKILDPAIREINDLTKYYVSYEAIKKRAKTRNKVCEIKFQFFKKKPLTKGAKDIEKTISVINITEIFEQKYKIDDVYNDLMQLYIENKFCSTPAEFFQATQIASYKYMKWFYESKINSIYKDRPNKLAWLLKDIKADPKRARFKDEINYYNNLLEICKPDERKLVKEAESRLGFASILHRLRLLNSMCDEINLENWL